MFLLYDGTHIRYLLPLVPGLALSAAGAAAVLGKGRPWRTALFLAPLVGLSAVQTARLDLLLCREDTRDLARRWIEARVEPGTRIAVEGLGPRLVPTAESLVEVLEGTGMDLRDLNRRERMILETASRRRRETRPVRSRDPRGRRIT